MEKKAYISGALTNIPDQNVKTFYERQATVCEHLGIEAYLPHKVSDPIKHQHLSANAVYEMDRLEVCSSHILVANVAIPSLGVGQEIEIARYHGVPILLLSPKSGRLSRLTEGTPGVVSIIRYEGIEDGLVQMSKFLRHFFDLEGGAASEEEFVTVRRLCGGTT